MAATLASGSAPSSKGFFARRERKAACRPCASGRGLRVLSRPMASPGARRHGARDVAPPLLRPDPSQGVQGASRATASASRTLASLQGHLELLLRSHLPRLASPTASRIWSSCTIIKHKLVTVWDPELGRINLSKHKRSLTRGIIDGDLKPSLNEQKLRDLIRSRDTWSRLSS